MKFVLILFLALYCLHADAPSKIWTITAENNIESTEDDFVSPAIDADSEYIASAEDTYYQGGSSASHIDDLPLAKTYPIEKSPKETPAALSQTQLKPSSISDADLFQRVKELQSVIQESVPSKETAVQKTPAPVPQAGSQKSSTSTSVSKMSKNAVTSETASSSTKPSEDNFYMTFPGEHPKMMAGLVAAVSGLMALLYLLFRTPNEKEQFARHVTPQVEDAAARVLIDYTHMKGEIHKAFLKRKENIFFHDEFTPYQRAKATMELEKEYNDLEYIQLPKLFSTDVKKFVEGLENLSSKKELLEILNMFASQLVANGRFTKNERNFLQQKIKNFYNVASQEPQNAQAAVKDEETAYLLQ